MLASSAEEVCEPGGPSGRPLHKASALRSSRKWGTRRELPAEAGSIKDGMGGGKQGTKGTSQICFSGKNSLNVFAKGIKMGLMVTDYRQCQRWVPPLFGQEGY